MAKNKFKYEIHEWVDIGASEIPASLLEKIEGWETYKDQVLKENIYGISCFTERFGEEGIPLSQEEQNSINKIIEILNKTNTGYVRFIY